MLTRARKIACPNAGVAARGCTNTPESTEMTTARSENVNEVDQARMSAFRATKGDGPIVVGPWLSEVGFELLYWIPFVRSILEFRAVDPARLVTVTRGGAHVWYQQFGGTHLDILDLVPYVRYRDASAQRVEQQGGQKHVDLGELDEEILAAVRERVPVAAHNVLHPSSMYQMLRRLWGERDGFMAVDQYLKYQPLDAASVPEVPGLRLPPDYVAVRFYHSPSFPATPENQDFACRTIEQLAQRTPVVLLNNGLVMDDHVEVQLPVGPGIHRVTEAMTPANNLAVQTAVVAKATAFYGTYGGFSYLAPFYGVPAVGYYSDPSQFKHMHLSLAYRVFLQEGYGAFLPMNVKDVPRIAQAAPAATPVVRSPRRARHNASAALPPPIGPDAMNDVADDGRAQPGASGGTASRRVSGRNSTTARFAASAGLTPP